MIGSFKDSAITVLMQRANALTPSYASRRKRTDTDVNICRANDCIGKLLALKDALQLEYEDCYTALCRKENLANRSLVDHMITFEVRYLVCTHTHRASMVVRSDGWIVLPKQEAISENVRAAA